MTRLDLPGIDRVLAAIGAGESAAVIVTDPISAPAGKHEVSGPGGPVSINLGEAVGPFGDLLDVPTQALRATHPSRLAELRDARVLYVVPVSGTQRRTEDADDDLVVGFHGHVLNRPEGTTENDGAHRHVWRLPEGVETEAGGTTLLSEPDGTHPHGIGESDTDEGEPHTHQVPFGTVVLTSEEDTEGHTHPQAVSITGVGGPHVHDLLLPDGTRLTSLTAAAFVETFEPTP